MKFEKNVDLKVKLSAMNDELLGRSEEEWMKHIVDE